jgi:hypothetical protein
LTRAGSKWSGAITFVVVVVLLALPVAWFEYLARMRAEGLCKALAVGMAMPDDQGALLAYVEVIPEGRRLGYVEPGVIPRSRHVCTITERDGKVVDAAIGHEWAFESPGSPL